MNNPLKYRCPFCTQVVSVAVEQIGQQIQCPSCSRPIRIDAPLAQPVFDDVAARKSDGKREQVLMRFHPVMLRAHPFRFLLFSLLIVGGIGLLVYAAGSSQYKLQSMIAGGLLATLGLGAMIFWWLVNHGTTLEITSSRTRLMRGLIAKRTSEVQHDDVRNLQVRQTVVQRLVNVGSLAVSSSGQDDLEIFVDGVPNPERIADEIRQRQ